MRDITKTVVPVTVIGALLTLVATGAWIGSEWKHALDENTRAVQSIGQDLKNLAERTVQTQRIVEWSRSLQQMNPELKVPVLLEK